MLPFLDAFPTIRDNNNNAILTEAILDKLSTNKVCLVSEKAHKKHGDAVKKELETVGLMDLTNFIDL